MAKLKAREADRRKDWCEKTSTMLARTHGLVRLVSLVRRAVADGERRSAQGA